jgi:hypothetical protein
MPTRVCTPFEVEFEAEPPHHEGAGATFGSATVRKTFSGAVEGTSEARLLGVQAAAEGSQAYVATERFEGTLEGRRGTFAMVHGGVMSQGEAVANWLVIVPESGTDELTGLIGDGAFDVDHDGVHTFVLDYLIDD